VSEGAHRGKQVLVTGGTGLIGSHLVKLLLEKGARVRAISLHPPMVEHLGVEYVQGDLMDRTFCAEMVRGTQEVFHLAAVRGSVGIGLKCAADFFVKPLLMNTHMMEEARKAGVERYLFTSSVCVYAPAEVFVEDRAWDGPPDPSDAYAGWAKRMGEMQVAAYREQYGWEKVAIVRPVNVYGPGDNFDPRTAQVIPALIARVHRGDDPLKVWGDGSAVRDFLYAEDAGRGILLAMERYACGVPVNLGSGTGYSIREVVETILDVTGATPRVEWDTSKPTGEQYRVADVTRARKELAFEPKFTLREGIAETVKWYRRNIDRAHLKKTAFSL